MLLVIFLLAIFRRRVDLCSDLELYVEFQMDPDEERRLLARERKAAVDNFNSTIRRHSLVLRKRDLNRKKAEEDKRKVIGQLLAAEGLELASDDDEEV